MAATRPASESWEVLSLPSEIQLSTGTLSIVGKNRKGSGDQKGESSSEQQTKIKESASKKLCGFLEKLGEKGLIKTWKRRWFVFQPRSCLLYYYRNPDDQSELGKINISDATFAINISSGRMDQFDIRTSNRVYHLQAEDQQTALYWLQELQARRREYSRKITAMCHRGEIDVSSPVIPEPSDASGLINEVVEENTQEEDDGSLTAIPAPKTVGENAAKRPQDGRYGISIKNMKTEIKNLTRKRYSMIVNPTQSVSPQDEDVQRSSSVSDGQSAKKLSLPRKYNRSSSSAQDKTVPECPKCVKLASQLVACTSRLEETQEYAQAREETIMSLNEYIRETVLGGNSTNGIQSETSLKDGDEKDKYIQKLERRLGAQNQELLDYKKEIAMLKEVISTKDEIVMKTTKELATAYGSEETTKKRRTSSESSEKSEKNDPLSSLGSSGESCRFFFNHIENLESDKEKVERLKEALRAYIAQNNFLNSEIVELNKLRKDDTERIRSYIVKNQTQEAELCKIKSKFYFLVQQVHEPVQDGQTGLPQEVVSQLLEEAIEIESQSKKSDSGSQSLFDRYGFYTKLERGDDDALAAVAGKLDRRSDEIVKASAINCDVRQTSIQVKWENYMMTNRNKEFQKTPELKTLIRSGIPHDLRGKIWLKCINNYVKAVKRVSGSGYYERLLESNKDCFSPAAKQIGLDLLRTLPNNKYYDRQDADGIDQLRRVLLAYSWHNPDIGYCQGLNRLAAIALLYLKEEDSFWALVALVEHVMPKGYYSQTMIASQADQRALKDILAEKIPKVSEHLDRLKIDLSLVTFNWFLTAFVDSVPIEIVLRIWDTLLYEGTKVLFRFAIAIFRVKEAEILEITDHVKMFSFLRNMPSELTNDEKFFQVAFQGLNPFPMQKISSLREYHLAALETELAELDRIRQEYVETKSDEKDPSAKT